MGQKVNPHGLRIGIIKDWDSVWFSEKILVSISLKIIKFVSLLRKNYIHPVFPESKSIVLMIKFV